jgi:hypothetical protein
MKSMFVCMPLALFGGMCLLALAQSPEGAPSSQPTSKADLKPAGKASVAESSNPDKAELSSAKLCQCIGRDSSAAAARIEQILAAPLHKTGLNYGNQPLQDVATELSDEYGLPIQINKAALEEAGIGSDAPVTINLHNISLRSALRLMLRTVQLTWMIQDEVLMITTKEDTEKALDTCVYNVQGLVDDSDPKSVKALLDVITGCVATDTWAVNEGGQAEIRPLPSGLLVVSQTPAVHEEVSSLLNRIRKMREAVPLTKVGPHGYESPIGESSSPSSRQRKKDSAASKTADNSGR